MVRESKQALNPGSEREGGYGGREGRKWRGGGGEGVDREERKN